MDRTIAIEVAIGAMQQNEQNRLRDQFAAIELYSAITLGTGMLIRTGAIVLVVVIIVVMFRKARRNEKLATAQADALRESELRFRRIFEESPLGIVLADPDSQRIVQANPAFCRMLGTESGTDHRQTHRGSDACRRPGDADRCHPTGDRSGRGRRGTLRHAIRCNRLGQRSPDATERVRPAGRGCCSP